MGLDLAWAVLPPDTVARLDEIRACGSGRPCGHDPRCSDAYSEIARGYEFRYRRLERFVRPMLELGMGFEAGQLDIDAGQAFANPAGWLAYDAAAAQERRPSGLSGIPVFKLRSNDAWLSPHERSPRRSPITTHCRSLRGTDARRTIPGGTGSLGCG